MQATVRTPRFGIDRMKLTLVAAGVVASTIAGATAVTLIGDVGSVVQTQSSTVPATRYNQHRYFETSQYATVRDERAGTAFLEANGLPVVPAVIVARPTGTEALEANGLPIAPVASQSQSSDTEDLEANGLPIAPHAASSDSRLDRADQIARKVDFHMVRQAVLESSASNYTSWTAYPGHAGFTAPDNDGTATLTRT